MPADWRQDLDWTRSAGTEWLAAGNELLLKVPSAIVPASYNYLFDPAHPHAGNAVVTETQRTPYDPRIPSLLRGGER